MLFTAVEKSRKRSGFVICSYFIDSVLQQSKECKVLNGVCETGTFVNRRHRKGLFAKTGMNLGAEPPHKKIIIIKKIIVLLPTLGVNLEARPRWILQSTQSPFITLSQQRIKRQIPEV